MKLHPPPGAPGRSRSRTGKNPPMHPDALFEYSGGELEAAHRAQGLSITADTAATRWRGEQMDYDLAVFLLCHKAERERDTDAQADAIVLPDVSAETRDRQSAASDAIRRHKHSRSLTGAH